MATRPSKLIIDTGILNDLAGSGYCLVEYTARHVLVTRSDMKTVAVTLWVIEEIEDRLNADYIGLSDGLVLLRWR